eukprot:scaffold18770_cov65-Attheya_sp.AAC.1
MTGAFEDFYRIHKMVRVMVMGANTRAVFDFMGTGPQVLGNHKALPAVTYYFYSAAIYSLRSLHIPRRQAGMAFTVLRDLESYPLRMRSGKITKADGRL